MKKWNDIEIACTSTFAENHFFSVQSAAMVGIRIKKIGGLHLMFKTFSAIEHAIFYKRKLECENRIKRSDDYFLACEIYFHGTNCFTSSICVHRTLVENGYSSSIVVDLINWRNLNGDAAIGLKVTGEAVFKDVTMDEVKNHFNDTRRKSKV